MYLSFDIETLDRAPDICPDCKEEVMTEKHSVGKDNVVCTKCGSIGKYWNFSNPNGDDYMPFMISCAAVSYIQVNDMGKEVRKNVKFYHGNPKEPMDVPDIAAMVDDLYEYQEQGHKIVAHNGAKFDFKNLWAYWDRMGFGPTAKENYRKKCMSLAANSIDLCFYSVCVKGWMLGLDAIAKGMNVEGKLHEVALSDGTVLTEMDGLQAIDLWLAGETDAVLSYLAEDVYSLSRLMNKLSVSTHLRWITKKGNLNSMPYKELTVAECSGLKKPPRIFKNSPSRESFVDWIDKEYLQ